MFALQFSFVALLATTSGTAPLKADDFAYARSIEGLSGAAVEIVELPVDLYQESHDGELDDLRVYNADGVALPHAIRTRPRSEAQSSSGRQVPHFAIRARGGSEALKGMRLKVERNQAKGLIQVEVDDTADKAEGEAQVLAYIVDLGPEHRPATGLEIEVADGEAQFMVELAVEHSDDLIHWQSVASPQRLVRLEQGEHRIERTRVSLPDVRGQFIRLSWPLRGEPLVIDAVHAEFAPKAGARLRKQLRVQGKASPAHAGRYEFDLAGEFPVEALELELPRDNTLARARLSSARDKGELGPELFSGVIYRVRAEGERLSSPPIQPKRKVLRHVTLQVDSKGGGLGSGLPVLVVHYLPQQLVFMTRDPAPFQLVTGRYGVANDEFDPGEFGHLLAGRVSESARLGARRELTGPNALKPPQPEAPWRLYLLWGVLLLGVLALATMARVLIKQLSTGERKNND